MLEPRNYDDWLTSGAEQYGCGCDDTQCCTVCCNEDD